MLVFLCAHKQMTDPFSSVMGKQYFALHLTGQSNELNTLPRLSRRLVSFLLFNFFPVPSLHPFLLSAMSSMFRTCLVLENHLLSVSRWVATTETTRRMLAFPPSHWLTTPSCHLALAPAQALQHGGKCLGFLYQGKAPNDRGAVLAATKRSKFPLVRTQRCWC